MRGVHRHAISKYMTNDITNTYELGAENGDVDSLVVLLHGLGSNGRDLIGLAPMWVPSMPRTVFVSPDAPFACDMVPPGYPDSYQWFSLQNRDPDVMLEGVKSAAPILESFISEQIQKYGVKPEKTALVGFSQGTMMSLYTAPRYKEGLAGVLGFSGALIGDSAEATHKLPIRLIHGEADDVVPVEAYYAAKEALSKAGHKVSGHTSVGLPHSIDEQGIRSGGEFLLNILGG